MRSSILLTLLATAGTAQAERLVDTREVARGDYLAPQFAPDGRELLVTGSKLRGLAIAPLAGGAVRRLTDDAEAGVHARWTTDGAVAYRALRAGARRDLRIDRDGRVRTAAPTAPLAFTRDDRMYVDRAGALIEIGSGDRFFGAVVAPDGDKVVFQGLATGLHLYVRSTGALVHIGAGTHPAWSPDSRRVVFEVTEDDGHDVVASDLYLYDVATDRVSTLTATERTIERRPSFAPSGASIAFDDNQGGVFVARVVP
ncbi:MAG: TolB family protein [Kofleriaceae bacterium]